MCGCFGAILVRRRYNLEIRLSKEDGGELGVLEIAMAGQFAVEGLLLVAFSHNSASPRILNSLVLQPAGHHIRIPVSKPWRSEAFSSAT